MKKDISNNLDFKLASSRLFPMLGHHDDLIEVDISIPAFDFAKRGLYAFEIYSLAIEKFPDTPFFYACRYLSSLMTENTGIAFFDYGKLVSLDRTYCDFIFYLLKSTKDHIFGSSLIENDYSLDDEWITIGQNLIDQGELDNAINVFNCGIKKLGEIPELLIRRGILFVKTLRYDLAYRDLNKVIYLMPEDAQAYLFLGSIYEGIKEYNTALEYYNKAILLADNDDSIYEQRAAFYASRKDYPNALNDYTICIKLNPNDANHYINRSFIYEEIDNLIAALQDTSQAIKLTPLNSEVYLHRSDIRLKLGDMEGAQSDQEISKKLDHGRSAKFDQSDDFDKIDGWDDDYIIN